MRTLLAALAVSLAVPVLAQADPCGMVPPISVGQGGATIKRTGPQKTYVFFKDGVEDIVLRPGYSGNVEEFGMLVALPSEPELRKVPDEIFAHIAAAIDPPEVVVDLRPQPKFSRERRDYPSVASKAAPAPEPEATVRVLKQEAVGMYEVAVLEAGSPKALEKWMSEHKFKYPNGMDAVVGDYVKQKWCFVAVKTRIAEKAPTNPQPGMRSVPKPSGGAFDGYIQGMGFRFRTPEAVVPMRLATYNDADERRQVVYALTEKPVKFAGVPDEMVKRQLPGPALHRNVNGPLPLRILGGELKDVPESRLVSLKTQRDPKPHNGHARELFAGDMHAAKTKELAMPHEEEEKELLNIGERMNLRGPQMDALHAAELTKAKDELAKTALADLPSMTLSIIDGAFPFELMRDTNLTLTGFTMPKEKNGVGSYDARNMGPGYARADGVLVLGDVDPKTKIESGGATSPSGKKSWYDTLWGN